jgi:hypothetical protein
MQTDMRGSNIRDLNEYNISKELVLDRSAWKMMINVSKP